MCDKKLFGIYWNINKSYLKGIVPTPGDCDFPPYFSKVKHCQNFLLYKLKFFLNVHLKNVNFDSNYMNIDVN
jgi:hypothetical protein